MNDISFTNMDTWRGGGSKFGLTFKQIILLHINRCVQNGSCEWHGGFWQERVHNNFMERYYIQNSREVFINSVEMLRAILICHFDKKMKEQDEKLYKELSEIDDEQVKPKSKQETFQLQSKKIKVCRRLFEELIKQCKRLNFFEEETAEEGL